MAESTDFLDFTDPALLLQRPLGPLTQERVLFEAPPPVAGSSTVLQAQVQGTTVHAVWLHVGSGGGRCGVVTIELDTDGWTELRREHRDGLEPDGRPCT